MNAQRPLVVAGASVLLLAGAATMGAGPLHSLQAYALLCPQPSLSSVGVSGAPSSQHGPIGSTVVLTGSNLDSYNHLGCGTTLNVTIGGTPFSVDSRNGSSTTQTFALGMAATGPVVVTNADGKSAGGPVFVTDPTVGRLPATPKVGQALSAMGSRLDLGGQLSGALVSWQTSGGSCPASTATVAGGGGSVSVPSLVAYCNGAATLTLSWSGGAKSLAVGLGSVDVAPTVSGVSPAAAPAGGAVTVHGSGFGTGGGATVGGVDAHAAWTDTAVTITLPDTGGGGAVSLTRPDGVTMGGGVVREDARIDLVSPASAAPGGSVTVSGGGFGAGGGSLSLGGMAITPSSWSPTSVSFVVPRGAQSGSLVLTPAAGAAATSAFSVAGVPGSVGPGGGTAGPGGSSSSSASDASSSSGYVSGGPGFIAPSADGPIVSTTPVDFQKSPAPAGPVSLTLASSSEAGDPGQSVPLNVTLVAFGKPVSGSRVEFLLVVEPGRDAGIDPAQVVTDAEGHATATLHLSSTAGDHIVLARSGQYSDEVRVVAKGASARPVASLGGAGRGTAAVATVTSGTQKLLIVGGLIACLVLFVTGYIIEVWVPRSPPAGRVAAGVGVVRPVAGRRWSRALTPFGVAERFTTLLQFACTVALVVAVLPPTRLVQRLARRG